MARDMKKEDRTMESFGSIRDQHIKNMSEEMIRVTDQLIEAGMTPEDVIKLVREILKDKGSNEERPA
jgi:hypothetical protein